MNYHNITKDDMLNGDGLRVVLWVAGCEHHCPNCQNPITWNPKDGLKFRKDEEIEIFKELEKDYVAGITFSGGDPLHPRNRHTVRKLAAKIKKVFPNKTIWLYTGYRYEQVCWMSVMQYIDVLVDGRFVEALKDNTLHWKGSSNQRVIDVQATRKSRKVVLIENS